jgi:hypothetical protein
MIVEHLAALGVARCCFVVLAPCLLNLFAENYAQYIAVEMCLVQGFANQKADHLSS